MGRLIDADKLLETLQDLEPHCENKDYEYGMLNTMRYYMPKIINDEPTAYDVDDVVEQLESLKNTEADYYYASSNDVIDRDDAIEIVKQVGVSDNVCEWIKYDYRTICPKNHDANNPYWRIPDNTDKLKYCPYCGKKIKVVE